MHPRRFLVSAIWATGLVLCAGASAAQTISESWLRQASLACGGGFDLEVQGEIDATLLKRLRLVDGEGNAELSLNELQSLLGQFSSDDARGQAQTRFTECLLGLVQTATDVSGLPPREVKLTSPVAVDTIETVKRGQRFVMVPGDTVAVADLATIFTVDRLGHDGRGFVYFTWSNSETGTDSGGYVYQAQLIKFSESCVITPFKIDAENGQVSFLSNC